MSVVVFAAPYMPPAPPIDPWPGVRQWWIAPDGVTTWYFSDPTSGVRMAPGVRGLTKPSWTEHVSAGAAVPGQRLRSAVARPRDILWRLNMYQDDSSQAWLDYDSAFWDSLRVDEPGTWVVEQPDGTTRMLRCRLRDDGDPSWDFAPGLLGWALYEPTLVADQPFWEGRVVESPIWGNEETTVNFTGLTDLGPPFYIMGASTIADATLTNPGDVRSTPTWTITGPTTMVTITVDDQTIGVPFALLEGQTLTIDTGVPVANLDGVDVTGQLDPAGFAAIPARGTVSVGIVVSGTGTVRATFPTLYERAW